MTMTNLISIVKAFDFFGESFTFKIRKRKYYTSIVGGISSIVFLCYSLYYFIYNLADFFGKNNRTIENEVKSVSEQTVKLTDHSYFMMAFCLRDSSMAPDNFLNSNLKMTGALINNKFENRRLSTDQNELKLENCNSDNFKGALNEIYLIKDFEGCQCLNITAQSNLREINLRSKYEIIDKEYLQFELRYQDKNLGANFAYFSDKLINYLGNNTSRLFVYFPTYSVEMHNITNPLKMNLHTEIYDIKPFIQQNSEIFLSMLNFTDFNSLYDDDSTLELSKLTFDTVNKISYYIPPSYQISTSLYQLQLSLSMRTINFARKVLRYDDFLGNMVGYLSNIIIILYCFNVVYNSFGARVYFAEKFFIKNMEFEKNIRDELKKKLGMYYI